MRGPRQVAEEGASHGRGLELGRGVGWVGNVDQAVSVHGGAGVQAVVSYRSVHQPSILWTPSESSEQILGLLDDNLCLSLASCGVGQSTAPETKPSSTGYPEAPFKGAGGGWGPLMCVLGGRMSVWCSPRVPRSTAWHTCHPSTARWRLGNQNFQVVLSYIASFRPSQPT